MNSRPRKNLLGEYMKSIKTSQYLFVGVATVIAIVWMILPDVVSEKEQGCYQRLMGSWMSYRTFNRVQFYYFSEDGLYLIK
jgi:hypothetical protein